MLHPSSRIRKAEGGTLEAFLKETIPAGNGLYAVHRRIEPDTNLPVLVFFHGFLGSGRAFRPILTDLLKVCNPVLIDLAGHGETVHPNDPVLFQVQHQLSDMRILLDQICKPPFFLFGYSMGGRLALRFALKHPQLLRGLLLESTSPGIEGLHGVRERMEKDQQRSVQLLQDFEHFLMIWNRQPMFNNENALEGNAAVHHQIQRDQRPEGIANSLLGFSPAMMPSVRGELHRLPMPVALISGRFDAAYVRHAEIMASLIPHSENHVVETAGHRVHLDAPAEVSDIISAFIQSHKPQS